MRIALEENQEDDINIANILKLVFIIIILTITLFFGFYPLLCKLGRKSTKFLGFFNSFSGGIFIGIGLFFLLPQSVEIMEKWSKANIKDEHYQEMPFCYFIAFSAYSFMLFMEKVLFSSQSLIPMITSEQRHSHNHVHSQEEQIRQNEINHEDDEDSDEDEEAFKNVVSSKGKFASFLGVRNLRMSHANNMANQPMDRALLRSSHILTKTFTKSYDYNHDLDLFVNPIKSDHVQEKRKSLVIEHSHQEESHEVVEPKKLSNATPYFLLFALCLDGFFEGIALGLQSTWDSVLYVASAIIINKIAVAFSLAISFKKAGTEIQTFIRFVILFSLFCPFGIVLGYFSAYNDLAKGILLSISSGTFIYVSCSVVIVEEFAITRYRFSKYFCYLVGGFSALSLVILGKYFVKN